MKGIFFPFWYVVCIIMREKTGAFLRKNRRVSFSYVLRIILRQEIGAFLSKIPARPIPTIFRPVPYFLLHHIVLFFSALYTGTYCMTPHTEFGDVAGNNIFSPAKCRKVNRECVPGSQTKIMIFSTYLLFTVFENKF